MNWPHDKLVRDSAVSSALAGRQTQKDTKKLSLIYGLCIYWTTFQSMHRQKPPLKYKKYVEFKENLNLHTKCVLLATSAYHVERIAKFIDPYDYI